MTQAIWLRWLYGFTISIFLKPTNFTSFTNLTQWLIVLVSRAFMWDSLSDLLHALSEKALLAISYSTSDFPTVCYFLCYLKNSIPQPQFNSCFLWFCIFFFIFFLLWPTSVLVWWFLDLFVYPHPPFFLSFFFDLFFITMDCLLTSHLSMPSKNVKQPVLRYFFL